VRYATPEAFRAALEDRLKNAENEKVGLSRLRERVVFEQLDAVAPRVLRLEPPDAGQRVIPEHLLTGIPQTFGKRVELAGGHAYRWVCLARRREVVLDPDMQLLLTTQKPNSATPT